MLWVKGSCRRGPSGPLWSPGWCQVGGVSEFKLVFPKLSSANPYMRITWEVPFPNTDSCPLAQSTCPTQSEIQGGVWTSVFCN